MLVGLLLPVVELAKVILFALHRLGSMDLFGIGGVTLFSRSDDLRTTRAEGLTLFA